MVAFMAIVSFLIMALWLGGFGGTLIFALMNGKLIAWIIGGIIGIILINKLK